MVIASPFSSESSHPGQGNIHLTLLPPRTPAFSSLNYTYPLKLLPSTPHVLSSSALESDKSSQSITSVPPANVPLLFLLTYGGGLVAGDKVNLSIRLDAGTRLTVTTQGSTKVFRPCTAPHSTTRQDLNVRVASHAGLWLAPDPVQPFAGSLYAQAQIFHVERGGSLGFVDWVNEGRKARGEQWAFEAWRGRNEVWDVYGAKLQKKRMLVRDAVVLDGTNIGGRMDGMGIFGTVILRGPLFTGLAEFFVEEFKALPRIGGRNWAGEAEQELTVKEEWRKKRLKWEKEDVLQWTACHVRGCTIIKFVAKETEGARRWLRAMLEEEGSVGRDFGPGGLMFVR